MSFRLVFNRGVRQPTRRIRLESRSFSVKRQEPFSSLLYPLAQEAPEIVQTQAKEAVSSSTVFKPSVPIGNDPFDDNGSISNEDVESIRSEQSEKLSTSLSSLTLPIESNVPPFIPPNVPGDQLETPVSMLTVMDNGIRVVSQETYGQMTTVGVVSQVGSRYEREDERGAAALIETLGFGTTTRLGSFQINQFLQDWGGTPLVNVSREQSLHCIDLLRPNAENAVALLAEALMRPKFVPEEIEDVQRTMEFQAMDLPPEIILTEAIQKAAYSTDQALGRPHFPTLDMPVLSPATLEAFWSRQFINNPQGIVIGAAGVQHDNLVEYVDKYFGSIPAKDEKMTITQSEYRGGQVRQIRPFNEMLEEKDLVRMAICLPTEGWHGEDLVAACVLQTLLGGGMSFSAGGPGKGMYSRLYRQVLNRYGWSESAEAFTSFYEDTGLWGISASSPPQYAREMTKVVVEHLLTLGSQPVYEEDLSRARRMLKNNVLTQLESRLVLFEDLSRQILTYGHREDMDEVCAKIDAITADDIMRLVQKSLTSPPCIASVGSDLSNIPDHSELIRAFQ